MNIETIRHEALLLPLQERAQLAEQLFSSLDTLTETEVKPHRSLIFSSGWQLLKIPHVVFFVANIKNTITQR